MSGIPFYKDVQEALREHGYYMAGGGGDGEEYHIAIRRLTYLEEGIADFRAGRTIPLSKVKEQIGLKDYLSVTEAARALSVHRSTIWRWLKAGKLSGERVGAVVLIKRVAVRAVLAERI